MDAVLTPSIAPGNWSSLPARAAIVSHGVRIGLGAHSNEALVQLISVLPPGARRARDHAVDITYTLCNVSPTLHQVTIPELIAHVGGEELVRHSDSATVLQALERHLHLHVAEHAPRRVFVHAGVVGWKGRAVVIPGTSYSGKSTLVAAFVRAGATYYSDEFAVVDSAGRIHPYLQPIQLRGVTGSRDPEAAREIPRRNGREALRVGVVLVTNFRPGAYWRPRPASAGAGMLALLANTVSARRDPKRALQNLTRMLQGAHVLKGTRGESTAVVRQLIRSEYLPE